jgi:hypothetical protein
MSRYELEISPVALKLVGELIVNRTTNASELKPVVLRQTHFEGRPAIVVTIRGGHQVDGDWEEAYLALGSALIEVPR